MWVNISAKAQKHNGTVIQKGPHQPQRKALKAKERKTEVDCEKKDFWKESYPKNISIVHPCMVHPRFSDGRLKL